MHIHLKGASTITCPKCSKAILSHTVCENCGFYRGREAIDVLSKLTKKERKSKEREMAATREEGTKPQGELSPEQLSRPTA
tara:strand:+ start:195 stop:437 length:243 start_codon:yes stop_codon:yes gene_type:complete